MYHMGEKRDERECAAKKEERRIRGGQIQFQRKKRVFFSLLWLLLGFLGSFFLPFHHESDVFLL